MRVAGDKARFGLPEINLGIMPGWGGTQRLQRVVGKSKAIEMILTGDILNAQEAYRIGLVNQVVPAAELMSAARKMAERMMESAPLALRAIKETVMKTRHMSLEEALPARFGPNVMASEDAREGTAAFGQKRKPAWKGK